MEPKLVLQIVEEQSKASKPVFIDVDLIDQLREIKMETGIPINRLVMKFIRFGLENVVIEGREEN